MNDALLVGSVEGAGDLGGIFQCRFHGNRAVQRLPLDEFHYQSHAFGRFFQCVQDSDVWMIQ